MLTKEQIMKMLLEGYVQEREALTTYVRIYTLMEDSELKEMLRDIIDSKRKHSQMYMDMLGDALGLQLGRSKPTLARHEILGFLNQRLKHELNMANSYEELLEMTDIGDLKMKKLAQVVSGDCKTNAKKLQDIISKFKKSIG